jgi:hypothetical protein
MRLQLFLLFTDKLCVLGYDLNCLQQISVHLVINVLFELLCWHSVTVRFVPSLLFLEFGGSATEAFLCRLDCVVEISEVGITLISTWEWEQLALIKPIGITPDLLGGINGIHHIHKVLQCSEHRRNHHVIRLKRFLLLTLIPSFKEVHDDQVVQEVKEDRLWAFSIAHGLQTCEALVQKVLVSVLKNASVVEVAVDPEVFVVLPVAAEDQLLGCVDQSWATVIPDSVRGKYSSRVDLLRAYRLTVFELWALEVPGHFQQRWGKTLSLCV